MDDDSKEYVSKSARKRRMTALQDIGRQLVELSDGELKRIPIAHEGLTEAIREARNIKSNSARKRQLRFISRLMRSIDAEPLGRALDQLHSQHQENTDAFHELECMRDKILQEGTAAIDHVLSKFSQADRQYLRQLVLQHQREIKTGKPKSSSRKIFRYLRELSEPGA